MSRRRSLNRTRTKAALATPPPPLPVAADGTIAVAAGAVRALVVLGAAHGLPRTTWAHGLACRVVCECVNVLTTPELNVLAGLLAANEPPAARAGERGTGGAMSARRLAWERASAAVATRRAAIPTPTTARPGG